MRPLKILILLFLVLQIGAPASEKTNFLIIYADEARKAGYQTAIVGKWHLGLESPSTPNERGFDHFHGFLGDMMDSYTTHLRHGENYMRLNSELIDPEGHATDLFTSDNGGSIRYAQNNDPWRGGKQDHYEGGLRVPFIVRWPGRVTSGTRSDYQGLTFDIFPSFLEIVGAVPSRELDAVSLLPVLDGGIISEPRNLYFVRREGGKSYEAIIRDGWKLMQNDPYSPLELYHLESDPLEEQNLMKINPSKTAELSPRLRKHIQIGGGTPWRKVHLVTP